MRLAFALLVGWLIGMAGSLAAQTSWTLRHEGTVPGDLLWSVTDGLHGAVTVGDGGKILHSQDGGQTWVARQSGTTAWIVAVTYGNGRYVAVGEGGLVLVSTNGIQWTRRANSGTTARLNNVLYADGKFVAVGEGGVTLASLDGGDTWQPTASAAKNAWLRGLAYGSKLWVATGQYGTVMTSLDGITWSLQHGAGDDLEAVTLAHSTTGMAGNDVNNYSQFLAVGQNGATRLMTAIVYTAPNAVSRMGNFWSGYESHPFGNNVRLRSITMLNSLFIATGENGAVYSAPSQYGGWTKLDLGTQRNLVAAGFVGSSLVLVGESRTIFQSEPIFSSRLSNVSTRGLAADGSSAMIVGFVVEGPTPKRFLIRGIGPGLSQFEVPDVVSDPVLRVYDGAGELIASNIGWSYNLNADVIAQEAANVGAFPLTPAAKDSALLLTLGPGAHTAQLSNSAGVSGNALVEVYDLDLAGTAASRAVNLSTRGIVGTGDKILIAGVTVRGRAARTLLVRAVGPGLAEFNVQGYLADPVLKVVAGNGSVLATNDDWSQLTAANGRAIEMDEFHAATGAVGAFALPAGSKDAALLITLLPGSYTLQVSGANNTTGIALVEAYEVPNR